MNAPTAGAGGPGGGTPGPGSLRPPGLPEGQRQDPATGDDRLHVVFGTGQVGSALATHLAGLGIPVRTVSRHRPATLPGIDWRAADATDPEAAADAAKGASVIYQCLNAPYTQWPERFPLLQRAVLAAAERTGALLVSLENLYGYGPTGGRPMTEDLPLAATTVKGRTRAAMTAELLAAAEAGRVRIAIGRASDFFGAGVTQGSTLGERVFGHALAGRRAWDVAISRATLAPPAWLELATTLAAPGGVVWVLLAKDGPPAHPRATLESNHAYAWPLTGAERRAVSYRLLS